MQVTLVLHANSFAKPSAVIASAMAWLICCVSNTLFILLFYRFGIDYRNGPLRLIRLAAFCALPMLESSRGISVPCRGKKLATGALSFDVKGFMDGLLGHDGETSCRILESWGE